MNKTLKKGLFALILSFSYLTYGQDNKGVVFYKKNLITPISYKDIKSVKFREFNKTLAKKSDKLKYTLEFVNEESIFQVIETMESDKDKMLEYAIRLGAGHGIRYTNISTKELIYKKEAYGKQFLITNNLDSLRWKLINESKVVNGYNCFKAVTSKTVVGSKKTVAFEVIAWYAPEIPLNFGPIGYAGLPGLIIELYNDKYKYYMTEMELNTKQIGKIKKPTKGKKMTLGEFLEYEKKLAGESRSLMRN